MSNSAKNEHKSIIGTSGSGKTHHAFEMFEDSDTPVLYYNFKNQPMEVVKNYKTLDGSTSIKEIEYCLKTYGFVNYLSAKKKELRERELQAICEYFLYKKKIDKVIIVIDEASMLVREGMRESPIIEIARVGRSLGVTLVVISQRLAGLSNEVTSQCDELYIHRLKPQDYSYLKRLGYDEKAIKDFLEQAPEFSHVKLVGAKMELIPCKK